MKHKLFGKALRRAICALAVTIVPLAFSGAAQSQSFKPVPSGSVGELRTVVSLAASRKMNTKSMKSIAASLSRINAANAIELIESRTPSLNSKLAKSIALALQSESATAMVVRSQAGQFLAINWQRGVMRKAGLKTVGAIIDLSIANGGISKRATERIGIQKGDFGGLCTGCNWTWGGGCTGCSSSMPKPEKADYISLRTLPVGRDMKISLFVLPRTKLGAVQCSDDTIKLAFLGD